MRDPDFKQQQLDGLRAPHVAPINALVDELRDPDGRGWVPYVAPVYGGIYARVLCIQRDPGPMTRSQHGGSGFLCPENDDATAERYATMLDEAGIAVSDILGWNAYPGTSTARHERRNWRLASSRFGGCVVFSRSCGS